jgi:eukaryotic-like serine/threonine-protein kinase
MTDLLASLERADHVHRRVASLAVVAAAVLVGAGAYGLATARREPPCDEGANEIADAWNPDVAKRLEARSSTLELAAADNIVARAIEHLDAYAHAWAETSIATCRAAHAGAFTEDEKLRRDACLDQSLAALAGLVQELEGLDASMLPSVSFATASLPRVADCERLDASTPVDAESVAAMRELKVARTAFNLGRYQQASATVERVFAEALERGDMWVAAEAGVQRCTFAINNDTREVAVRRCEQAGAHAVQSGHMHAAGLVWSVLFAKMSRASENPEMARSYELLADAAAEALDDTSMRAALAASRSVSLASIDTQAALAEQRRAVELEVEARGPDHPMVARRRVKLATYLWSAGEIDEALELIRSTRARAEAENGSDDPIVVDTWVTEGEIHSARDSAAEAVVAFARAVEGQTRLFGPDHRSTLQTRVVLLLRRGALDESALPAIIAELDVVLGKLRAMGEARSHSGIPAWEAERAKLLQRVGRSDEAIQACLAAVDAAREVAGPDTAPLGVAQWTCGEIHADRNELDEALAQWEAALAVCEKVNGSGAIFCVDLANKLDDARAKWNRPPRAK